MRFRSIISISPDGDSLDDALETDVDAILLTVAHESIESTEARGLAAEALPHIREAGKLALVAVNHPSTGLLEADLEGVVSPCLDAVLLTGALEPQDLRDLAVGLRRFELERSVEPGAIRTFPVINSARGLLAASAMMAAIPRNLGLVFDARAYARDVGGRHEEQGPRFGYARGVIVAAARAYGGLPLVMTYPYQARDLAQQGFAGIIMSEPSAAFAANEAFTPMRSAVERARAQLDAWNAAVGPRGHVIRHDGIVIDAAAARQAQQILDAAGQA